MKLNITFFILFFIAAPFTVQMRISISQAENDFTFDGEGLLHLPKNITFCY